MVAMAAVATLRPTPRHARLVLVPHPVDINDLLDAYLSGQVQRAQDIAEALLAASTEYYDPTLDARIQLILAWAVTEGGWYQTAQVRLEQAARHTDGMPPALRAMILGQYAVTMLKFMLHDPERYSSTCDFDISASLMHMLDREITEAGDPPDLRAIYRQTDAVITRILARRRLSL